MEYWYANRAISVYNGYSMLYSLIMAPAIPLHKIWIEKNINEPLEMFRHNMFWKKWILQEVTGNTCLAFPYENIAAETK